MTSYNLNAVEAKTCCASLYHSDAARLLLGESLHPGGLGLTHRLGRMAGLVPGERVLDVACGRGASARALTRAFKCSVVGVDLDRYNLRTAIRAEDIASSPSYLLGDGEALPFARDAFDAVVCECSMSLFPNKSIGAQAFAHCLKPGGRVAMSDVTVERGALPAELTGTIGQMLCVADALPVQGYSDILEEAGLGPVQCFNASSTVVELLDEIKEKLSGLLILEALKGSPTGLPQLASLAGPILDKVQVMVREGAIGYWLFVAPKYQS